MIIVVAWTTTENVHDGRAFAADLGHRPRLVERKVAKSAVWLNDGGFVDVTKAQAWCERENAGDGGNRQVFVYVGERDPLGRARKEVLALAVVAGR